jgi:saccharopine dehydrogenase-like NADP-dependent oxidoreductase
VVAQTAFNPLIALELLAAGTWKGSGVVGPEVFDAKPFLDLMASSTGYNQKWVAQERLPASPLRHP